jgi:NAD(P)H-dependent FMN reductase
MTSLGSLTGEYAFVHSALPEKLPLFTAEKQEQDILPIVASWRKELNEADGVIFCIPEYIHNMPALIKNALEWITASGELAGKKVLALTFTPNAPRGEKAMQSLLWSLQALDAHVLASLSLYQTEIAYTTDGKIIGDGADILKEALDLFR